MKFSVLMTVYKNDRSDWFDIALQSLFDQTLIPTEIVLVKDGPLTGELEKVIDKYENDFPGILNVYGLDKNIGQGNALNYGLERCLFDYVARMDSDDISHTDRFMKQISYLEKNSECDILSALVEDFDSESNVKLGIRKVPQDNKDIIKFSKIKSPFNHGVIVYKRSKILELGAYNSAHQCQDYDLWVRAIQNGLVSFNLQNVLMDVRISDNYKRKSGLSYFKEELILQKTFYVNNHLSAFQFVRNIVLRAVPRLFPPIILRKIYRHVLRN